MLTNEAGTHEFMINAKTGEFFKKELTREEQAYNIINRDFELMNAQTKFEKLKALGFSSLEIFSMILDDIENTNNQ